MKMKLNIKTSVITLIFLSHSLAINAETIDFEGTTISQDTYQVEITEGTPMVTPYGDFNFSTWAATYLPNNFILSPLSTTQIDYLPADNKVFFHPSNGTASVVTQRFIVVKNDNTQFTLSSIDIAEKVENINVGQVSIKGFTDADNYIEQTFDVDMVKGFETVSFDSAWSNLVKIDVSVEGSNHMHFDNIVVY
tara:strand:+ start:256 stop:834 length:579 start_codon:yes stop_codon:yes gene_type:complete